VAAGVTAGARASDARRLARPPAWPYTCAMTRWLCLTLSFAVALSLGLIARAPAAHAHPHVFVDVTLRFLPDEHGRLSGVEVIWRYDDFFSLLVLEDMGLDPDGDMELTGEERAVLKGFDLADWPEGFEGALFLEAGGETITLDPPEPIAAHLDEGRIVTRHLRRFTPLRPASLVVRPYDPSYYAALTLSRVGGLPDGCKRRIEEADKDAADEIVAGLGGAANENLFEEVEVGIHYADTLEITCAPLS